MKDLLPPRVLSALFLAALTILMIWLAYQIMKPFLEAIFFAVVLAVAFQPLYQRLSRLFRRTELAAIATIAAILLAVLTPMILIALRVTAEGASLYQLLAERSSHEGGWGAWISQQLDGPLLWASQRSGVTPAELKSALISKAQAAAGSMLRWTGSFFGNITSTIADAFIVCFTMFFLFSKWTSIHSGIYRWLPLPKHRINQLLQVFAGTIVANLYGIAVVAIVQGVLTGIGLLIAGIPSAMMWGLIAAFLSLVPVVGAGLVWVPACVYLFLNGSTGFGVFMLAWGAGIVSMADNVLRPLLLKGRTNMNTLPLFFALLGGMQAFGFPGLFIGPVVFSLVVALLEILREEYQDAGPAEAAPEA